MMKVLNITKNAPIVKMKLLVIIRNEPIIIIKLLVIIKNTSYIFHFQLKRNCTSLHRNHERKHTLYTSYKDFTFSL